MRANLFGVFSLGRLRENSAFLGVFLFVFMPLRANRAASHRFYSAAILICLPLVTPMTAPRAGQIGVTAALRGLVVRTASLQTGTPIRQMSSGQKVFLGDDIKVGAQGRLQVMLLDETVFTLGANSVMRIDEFVYDPGRANIARLTTSIKSGAFRFVSGLLARLNNDAMKVKLPAATISVRSFIREAAKWKRRRHGHVDFAGPVLERAWPARRDNQRCNDSDTQSNLTDFTSDTTSFSLTFTYAFNY